MSTALQLGNKLGEAISAPTNVSTRPAPMSKTTPSTQPYPEIAGLLLLALALLFTTIVLAPEARIERVPVNDLSFHLEASQRLGESIAHGEPFMDPWVSQWSLGFPLWRVYQPLPHLLAAVVIALARPFGSPAASFAALYYALLVLMPAGVYLGARLMGLNPLAAGLASILILAPAEEGDFSRYGLSFDAYAWRGSGLFSELIAFEMLMLALGLVARAIDSGKRETTAALALALTALAHVFFGYIAFVSIAFWALVKPGEGRAQRITRAVSIAAKAMLLLAWFVIPMVLGGAEVNRSRWDPAYKFDSYGAQTILKELFSGKLLDFGRLPMLSLMVAAAALIAAFNLKDSIARRLLVLTGLWLALYFGRPTWGHLLVLAGIPSQFHLHRLEAAFELFAVLLAAWGLERIIAAAIRSPGLVAIAMGAVLGGALVLIAAERVQYLSLNAQWGESNLTAYAHERGDLDAALADVRTILAERPGRVSAGKAAEWGGTFNIGSAKVYSFLALNGMDEASFLYHTISLTSEFMVLRDENDPVHEDLFGIRAVLAPVTLKLQPWFRKRGVHGRFAVYEASPTGYFSLVDIGARYDGGPATWFDPISGWLRSPMLHAGEVIALDPRAVAAPLITRWQQLPAPDPKFMTPRGQILSETKVGEDYRASIDAQRLCYALIKITYHPGLVAWVDGQRAPLLRVSPDFGAIALVPGHHDVEVRYQPGPLKPLLLLVGLALFVLAVRPPLLQAWESAENRLQEQLVVCGEWLTTDRVKIAVALALLILLFTRGLFRGQLIDGHDSGEYPARLSEFSKIIGEHQFPPVWAPDLDNGHGQPLFEFAPPLIYVTALPFYEGGVKLADSLQFGLVILFAMGAIAVYLLGRRMSFSRIASLGGAAVWLFAPYQSLDVYVSARFAEASAIAMAPVALLGLITALQNPTILNVALGAVAIALLPLAHNAIALLMFPIFALIILARSAVSDRPVRTAAAGAAAIAGGLGLSAFFWLPALLEKDFVKTNLLRTDFLDWRFHIISPWQLFWGKWGFGYSVAGPNDGISFSLGWVHIALAIAGIVIGIRALNRMRRVDAMIFAGAVMAGSLLATEWTSPIWAHVATLQYMAYPWRTLCIPALFMPLLALYVFDRLGPKSVVLLIAAVVLVNLPHTEPKGYLTFDEEFYEPSSIAQRGLNTTTREEYEPRWARQRMWGTGNGFLNSPLWQSVRELYWTSTSHEYSVVTKSPMLAIDTTDYYPGWTVTIDGRETNITPEPMFGLISFQVPPGQHTIKIELLPTRVRHLALMLSILTLAALLLAIAVARYGARLRKLWPRAPSHEPSIESEGDTVDHVSLAAGHSLANEVDALARATNVTSAKLARIAGVVLLAVFVGQGLMFIRANSQTFDEAIHLVSGYSYLTTRDFRLFPQHAPLVPELSALPVYLWYRLPFKPIPELWNRVKEQEIFGWTLGRDFLYGSPVAASRLLTLSRIPNLLLGAILVALVGWWSFRLWGAAAAIVGIWLAAVDPNLVANSSLVTSDLAPALFSFATLYLLWEYKRRTSGWLLAATGISLGLALVSKFSTVLLLPILALVVIGEGLSLPESKLTNKPGSHAGKMVEGFAAAGLILFFAALVVPLAYFGFRRGFFGWIAGFQAVMALQKAGFRAYLMGSYSGQGWWSYFLVAFLVKTPAGTLFLIFAALALCRIGAPLGRKEAIFLVVPPIAFIAAASIGKIDVGLRHILPMYPFLFVLASRIATAPFRRAWVAPVLCGLPLMLSTVSSLGIAPHDLAYFNELAGGPGNGYRYLSDSNIDWGQDLQGLKAYMEREKLPWIYLSYFGTALPGYYGIHYQYVPTSFTLECCPSSIQPPGTRDVLAISVVNLQGVMTGPQNNSLVWLDRRTPIAKIGYSIYVYDITGDAEAHFLLANAYLSAGGLLPQALSELAKAQALDPSNLEAKRLASLLAPPGAVLKSAP